MPSFSDQILGIIIASIVAGGTAIMIKIFDPTLYQLFLFTGICFVPLCFCILIIAMITGFWKQ